MLPWVPEKGEQAADTRVFVASSHRLPRSKLYPSPVSATCEVAAGRRDRERPRRWKRGVAYAGGRRLDAVVRLGHLTEPRHRFYSPGYWVPRRTVTVSPMSMTMRSSPASNGPA